jgi:putative oxidoreductase
MDSAVVDKEDRMAAVTTLSVDRSRSVTYVVWTLQILAAAMFLMAGISKLAGAPDMVQAFSLLGLGQWFRYLTATIEIASAVLLLIPPLAVFGALALAATMIGAVIAHLTILGGSPVAPILLLAATMTIAWIRSEQFRRPVLLS